MADKGVTGGLKTVSYVVGDNGRQELVTGQVWQPVNIVNRQAWLEIEKQIELSRSRIAAGKVSCLHYYMIANQMDLGLLAGYTSQSRLRVRLHLVPFFFNRLGTAGMEKYAEVFKVPVDDLVQGKLSRPVYDGGLSMEKTNGID